MLDFVVSFVRIILMMMMMIIQDTGQVGGDDCLVGKVRLVFT